MQLGLGLGFGARLRGVVLRVWRLVAGDQQITIQEMPTVPTPVVTVGDQSITIVRYN
jgi:hypothetical protein